MFGRDEARARRRLGGQTCEWRSRPRGRKGRSRLQRRRFRQPRYNMIKNKAAGFVYESFRNETKSDLGIFFCQNESTIQIFKVRIRESLFLRIRFLP
jgi:hypothetical protein